MFGFKLVKESEYKKLKAVEAANTQTVLTMHNELSEFALRVNRLEKWVTLLSQITNGMASGTMAELRKGKNNTITPKIVDETLGGLYK